MASKSAIPSRLNPGANGEGEFQKRHHGKTQSHVVSTQDDSPLSSHEDSKAVTDPGTGPTAVSSIITAVHIEFESEGEALLSDMTVDWVEVGRTWERFHQISRDLLLEKLKLQLTANSIGGSLLKAQPDTDSRDWGIAVLELIPSGDFGLSFVLTLSTLQC